ncbi:MAG TPA: lipoprotein [Gammaproteobacteria bacterium]|nr:lipoprotein [Gammaproteobacteria bacterium]
MRALKPWFSLFLLASLLSACGQSGGLYLPTPTLTKVSTS